MNIDDWKSQIKRGTLEFCILLMIKQRPSYGYEIRLCFILMAGKRRGFAAEKVLFHYGQRT